MRDPSRTGDSLLDSIKRSFGLSETELASLCGIQRASLGGWREHGIPQTRLTSVERLADLAAVFARTVRHERIPEIVRTPDAWLDGRTILEAIKRDGPASIYAYLSRLFAYSG